MADSKYAKWMEMIEEIRQRLSRVLDVDGRVSPTHTSVRLGRGKIARTLKSIRGGTVGLPYKVVLKWDKSQKLVAMITFDIDVFEKHQHDWGDKTEGLVNVVIRAFCEQYARSAQARTNRALERETPRMNLHRAVRMKSGGTRSTFFFPEEEDNTEDVVVSTHKRAPDPRTSSLDLEDETYETPESVIMRHQKKQKKKAPKKTKAKFRKSQTGWYPAFISMMKDVCGSASIEPRLGKPRTPEGELQLVNEDTWEIRRFKEEEPKNDEENVVPWGCTVDLKGENKLFYFCE